MGSIWCSFVSEIPIYNLRLRIRIYKPPILSALYHHRCWLHLLLITVWMVFFMSGTEPPFFKQAKMWTLSIHLTWSLLHTSDVWLPPCVLEFQVALLDAAASCVKWWISKVLLSPCGYIHHIGMTQYNVAWGLRGHTHLAVVFTLGFYALIFAQSLSDYYVL